MANVQSYGSLISRTGATIPVLNTATTEATEDNVQTDANFVGSAQDVGTYGDQLGRFILSRGAWICETDSTYNFIRSAGTIKAVVQDLNIEGMEPPNPIQQIVAQVLQQKLGEQRIPRDMKGQFERVIEIDADS